MSSSRRGILSSFFWAFRLLDQGRAAFFTLEKSHATLLVAASRPGAFTELFTNGARWMHGAYGALHGPVPPFPAAVRWERYGWWKYGISAAGAALAFAVPTPFCAQMALFLVVFYALEVQLLFLFPLLIFGVPAPVRTSVRLVWEVGFFQAWLTTILLAGYMLAGLLRWRSPLQQWCIGCLCVVLWAGMLRSVPKT